MSSAIIVDPWLRILNYFMHSVIYVAERIDTDLSCSVKKEGLR